MQSQLELLERSGLSKLFRSVPGLNFLERTSGSEVHWDMSQEPRKILDLCGAPSGDGSFASNCLPARRLAERRVRFIQLYHRDWDHHGSVKSNVRADYRS